MKDGLLRDRRVRILAAAFAVVAPLVVAWRGWSAAKVMRPWEGAGIVAGKREARGEPVTLLFQDGTELPVLAIASRIDSGDRVEKRAGELSYEVNGRRVSPLGTVIGSLIFFWLFLPPLAFLPLLILEKTRED